MSFTLTNRDTAVLTMAPAGLQKDGVLFQALENSSTVRSQFIIRHTAGSPTGTGRHNVRLERRKFDATSKKWYLQTCDVTYSQENSIDWSADEADDLITATTNYFDSEATSGAFANGSSKS